MLGTLGMKTLRQIAGKTLRDQVRNDEISRASGVYDIIRWGRQKGENGMIT